MKLLLKKNIISEKLLIERFPELLDVNSFQPLFALNNGGLGKLLTIA